MDDNSREVGLGSKETEYRKTLNILLVEDDESVALLIKRVLKDHNVTAFTTAEEALEALRKSKEANSLFDWVITDKGLAGKMDGFGLTALIKSETLGNPFVTLLTASAVVVERENSPAELREKGINQLMGKPFNVKDLRDSVNVVREFGRQSQGPQLQRT